MGLSIIDEDEIRKELKEEFSHLSAEEQFNQLPPSAQRVVCGRYVHTLANSGTKNQRKRMRKRLKRGN